jgi:hypothetical protein
MHAPSVVFVLVITHVLLLLARTQTPVDDDQFLRSMIPHHSSAFRMCEQATITDPTIKAARSSSRSARRSSSRTDADHLRRPAVNL